MEVEYSVVIHRPVDQVFDLVGNPDNDPKWGSLIAASRQSSPAPLGKGTTFEQTAAFLGANIDALIEVTEYDPGRAVCYEAVRPLPLRHCRTFEEVPEGTRLTFRTQFDIAEKFRLPQSFAQRMARRQMEGDMDEIKALMEAS